VVTDKNSFIKPLKKELKKKICYVMMTILPLLLEGEMEKHQNIIEDFDKTLISTNCLYTL
jgi:hypothetical protein